MSDFSIELRANTIVDSRTRRYFSEVYGCYTAGYYRSAVVMLWSVVVTDIMFKLEQLATAYNDSTANDINKHIEEKRTGNSKSPDWELELVKQVWQRTDLLDNAEYTNLEFLRQHRHLSAHPVLTNGEVLFAPSKEMTRAHIRNVLDAVLTKPPIMSKKIFTTFIEDIEQIGRLSLGPEGLKKYLETKYFPHFSDSTFTHIVKNLWRITFKSTNPRAENNRVLNTQALNVVFTYRKDQLMELIKSDRTYFSEVSFGDGHLIEMSRFFCMNPKVFHLLTDAIKTPIQKYADISLDHFVCCWFINPNLNEHLQEIIQRVIKREIFSSESYSLLYDTLNTSDSIVIVLNIGIYKYFHSQNFDSADQNFDKFIRPYIQDYTRDNLIIFLELCETNQNNQITDRRRVSWDHKQLQKIIQEKFSDIALDDYPVFQKSLS